MNMDKSPFDKVLVRHALNHAINKQALVDNFYQGPGGESKKSNPSYNVEL